MLHNYIRDDHFNILTAHRDKKKGRLHFTGEAKNGITIGDYINYPFGGFAMICEVEDIIERRDAKAYPEGNGYYYDCVCKPFEMDSNFIEEHKEEAKCALK